MVKMSFSPSVQKKKWTKSGQNPVIYKDLADFPGRAIFSGFSHFFMIFMLATNIEDTYRILTTALAIDRFLEFCCVHKSCEKVWGTKNDARRNDLGVKVYITKFVSSTKTAWGRRATGERGCGVWGQGRGGAEKDGEKREMGPRQIGVGGRRRRKSWEWGCGCWDILV